MHYLQLFRQSICTLGI